MVLLVSTQFEGLEMVCCRPHRSLTPRPHPLTRKTVWFIKAMVCSVYLCIYLMCVCAGGEKATGGGRESGSDAWKQYMRRSTW